MGRIEDFFSVSSMNEHQHAAIKAAQRGNWKKADALELEYLNAKRFQIFPDIPLDRMSVAERARLRATDLYRGLAPNGQIGVRWTTATKQDEFEGNYTDAEVWFTDIDGNLIEVDRAKFV